MYELANVHIINKLNNKLLNYFSTDFIILKPNEIQLNIHPIHWIKHNLIISRRI